MKRKLLSFGLFGICWGAGTQTKAQLTIGAQLRTRTELRDGQGAPLSKGQAAALFTSQRSRLHLGFNSYRLKLGITAQDVRVWGQDASTINRTTTADNNGLLFHEAWAEISLLDTTEHNKTLGLKLGRQEWIYDDARLLGNLDWLQQGRRHDGAVVKFEQAGLSLHAGLAFNQNKELASGTGYNNTPAGNYPGGTNGSPVYKSLQFVYAGRKYKKGTTSYLLLADQFNKYQLIAGSNGTTKVPAKGAVSRFTTGVYTNNTFNRTNFTGAAYYQFGKNSSLQRTRAWLLSAAATYSFTAKLSAGAGIDYTSGGNEGNTSNAFDPLYGTPHKFWGLMDYFYVASPFGKGGLANYYLKSRYKASDKLAITADLHQFNSATAVAVDGKDSDSRSFGQELDLTASFALTKQIGFEAGYAHFFATALLSAPAVKHIPNARSNANWAYLMINIKPEFLFK